MNEEYKEIIEEIRTFLLKHPYMENRFIDAQFVSDCADIEISFISDTVDCNKVMVDRLHMDLKYFVIDKNITLPKFRVFFMKDNQILDRYLF
jgi:hypothetical protein